MTTTFSSLDLSPYTRTAIERMGFESMTDIQKRTIPPLLAGKDVLGAAKTGSGKTIAFLVPAIELLCHTLRFKPLNGESRESLKSRKKGAFLTLIQALASLSSRRPENWRYKSSESLENSCRVIHRPLAFLMGGANRRAEAEKLAKGVNLIVATPGRLLDHLQNTKGFVVKNLKALVIDEADTLLSIGFEEELQAILKLLPKERQTALFSATLSTSVNSLAKISLRPGPLYINVDEDKVEAVPTTLQQGYIVVESSLKFLLLYTYLRKNLKKKSHRLLLQL